MLHSWRDRVREAIAGELRNHKGHTVVAGAKFNQNSARKSSRQIPFFFLVPGSNSRQIIWRNHLSQKLCAGQPDLRVSSGDTEQLSCAPAPELFCLCHMYMYVPTYYHRCGDISYPNPGVSSKRLSSAGPSMTPPAS